MRMSTASVYNVRVTSKRIFPTARIDYNITDNHRFTSAFGKLQLVHRYAPVR